MIPTNGRAVAFYLPRPVKKACERPRSAQEARPAGHALREVVLCNDLADERLELRWGGGELQRFTEHGFRFGKQGFVFGEESDEGLACFKMCAKFGMHLNAGVGADKVAGLGAACSEALNGPANLLAVHGGEVAGVRGGEGFLRQGFVVNSGVGFAFKEGDVSSLSLNDLEEGLKGSS